MPWLDEAFAYINRTLSETISPPNMQCKSSNFERDNVGETRVEMCSLAYLRLLVLMFSAQRWLLVTEEIWPNAGNVKRSFASKGPWKKDTRNIIAAKSSPCHVSKSYNEEI